MFMCVCVCRHVCGRTYVHVRKQMSPNQHLRASMCMHSARVPLRVPVCGCALQCVHVRNKVWHMSKLNTSERMQNVWRCGRVCVCVRVCKSKDAQTCK